MATEILEEASGQPAADLRPDVSTAVGQNSGALVSDQHDAWNQSRPASRHWRSGLAILAVVVLVVAAAWLVSLPARTADELGPALTHTVSRGNLTVTIVEQGTLESVENIEVKCKVRGENTVIWVIENGTEVEAGDELVRLDTLTIEDQINERSKYALWSLSGAEQSRANARRAELAIDEYLKGRYVAQLKTLQKDLAIAESNLRTSQNMLAHAERMFERGYVSELEIEEKTFAVTQAGLSVDVKKTEIEVLNNFTKPQELERLKGDFLAAQANRDSLDERAKMDGTRRDLALAELELCVITAPKSGMVIYPSAQAWEKTPDIEEGATVHRDQVLLLMPDLAHMQVKVGVHESMIDRIQPGQNAKIKLPELRLEGQVSTVASVARPAGWWTGNVVKYDTIITLPSEPGLRPGMSAEVEIVLAEHSNVVTIPVAAVLESSQESLCWVKTPGGFQRRSLKLGDSNDVFIVVESGLDAGEEVVLNPRASIKEAKDESLKTAEQPKTDEEGSGETETNGGVEANSAQGIDDRDMAG